MKGSSPFLDSRNGTLDCFQIGDEPFIGFVDCIEDFLFDTGAFQDIVYLLVVE